ncbi:molybdenum ABC transporter ATP-binding protein [Arhodomonas sp. SL1]|uniref:molybdenum ABC transporter ATP-binding protein n=1 Tax=Arhodomonas sp. SL1 TaxID=3425691 RepID=UPI003F88560E
MTVLHGSGDLRLRFLWRRGGFALDVDLTLPGSGVTAVFGPSGSGKTTLLRLIAGLEQVPGGYVAVDGETWQGGACVVPVHRRPVGYVFQDARLFPHLNVADNLEYGRRRSTAAMDESGLAHAIELLGIGHLLERMPSGLSGGERQRVAIARALALRPRLLLMDEPLAALDAERKREILPYLERLRGELDVPMLYVSHSPDEVARLADHLVVLEQGRALASGPLRQILARLDLPIRLGDDAGVVLDAVVGAVDRGWHLMRLDFAGGALWARDHGVAAGRAVRVRVLARDVSLARQRPAPSSIQNVLPGQVDALGDEEHPGTMLARVRVGEDLLLARLTRRAAASLGIAPGADVWLQVKSVALLE